MGGCVTIVVGVDGSTESRSALCFAMTEAARRRARVEVVRAFAPGVDLHDTCGIPPLTLAEVTARLAAAVRVMVHAVVVEAADPVVAEVPIEVVALVGAPRDVLVDRSRRAGLLVVGHRGSGGAPVGSVGSVGLHCAARAYCPVTVVPAEWRARRRPVGAPAAANAVTSPTG
jgi:nucleotide-binding universal stress UspA family protein